MAAPGRCLEAGKSGAIALKCVSSFKDRRYRFKFLDSGFKIQDSRFKFQVPWFQVSRFKYDEEYVSYGCGNVLKTFGMSDQRSSGGKIDPLFITC